MSPIVLTLLMSLNCAVPPPDFRTFYADNYQPKARSHWFGRNLEPINIAMERLADAIADYADYRAERADRCSSRVRPLRSVPLMTPRPPQ